LMATLGAGIFIGWHSEYCKEVRELHLIGNQFERES